MKMRTFKRTTWAGHEEVIGISEYGFEVFIDGVYTKSGCVENFEEDIAALIEEGFIEV